MIILISFATFIFTLLGGLFALKMKDKLHLILGFSAGAVIGVAFFDLLPEALELGKKFYESSTILAVTAAGFLIYLVLDRVIFLHGHSHEHDGQNEEHGTNDQNHVHVGHEQTAGSLAGESHKIRRGILGAGSLCIHSFLDGVAIGLAFQVSTAIGAIVAVAVLTHDFSDGINTVNLILKGDRTGKDGDVDGGISRFTFRGDRGRALRWLIADAVAPVLGALSTLLFTVPEQGLSIILALFSGFFLYIGASDLIPESHHAHPKFLTTVMTLIGAGVLYLAIRLAGS